MEKKIYELLLILGGIALSMFAAVKILSGGFVDLIWFMVCLVPFLLALFLGMRNWWPLMAIIIPALPLPKMSAVLLERLTPTMIFNVTLLALFIGYICIRHKGVSLSVKYARPLMIVAVCITIRLLMDPPGSGRVGGTGGLGLALDYLIAGWAFFSIWWATESSTVSDEKLCRAFLFFSLILFGLQFARTQAAFSMYELYHRRAWLLYPFLLGLAAYRLGVLKNRWGVFYALSLAVMACGVIHPHRKSVAMAGLTCMAVAWVFERAKKQMIVLGVSGVLGLTLLIATGHVPDVMKRALSTLLPQLTIEKTNQGYMGWNDEFRTRNFQLAMQDIVRDPIIGKGFAFSTEEVVALLNREKYAGLEGSSDLLSSVGMHHYGFISLMTCIGAVIPWFYVFGGLGVFFWFARVARALPPGYPKVLAVGLIGYFINNLVQWLFNGAGEQMLMVSIVLGIMMGLLQRWNAQSALPERSGPEPENSGRKTQINRGVSTNGWARPR